MNAWLLAACVLLPAGLAPCVWRACVGEPARRLPAMALAGVMAVAFFLLAARGLHRTSYVDVALVTAVLSPTGTLVFARCLAGGAGRPADPTRDGPGGRD
ncbi:monovalent cation/H+ antiporter complex subunit F [Streptomyces sp. NBC_01198]|uniref:monovalent cation/H+ antiporter complex subunit F n=1 Tax=Streptomyces sp. NBC_01198 TaxID=2903769 RepID=UPI002E160E4E|nr:monovalent cation/H+ antiporter complex subunit F [Streptomyces sp. NBC_01198]